MNWFAALVRIAGSTNPLTAPFVQLQAEIDSRATQGRLRRIEDPVSTLHPDIREVSGVIYEAVKRTGRAPVKFDDAFYGRYARSLAILESQGFIRGQHTIGEKHLDGFWLDDPHYVVAYLCALFEDPAKMDRLFQLIDETTPPRWLKGEDIALQLDLPLPVVRAVFQLYESRGLGLLSKELGTANYSCRA